MAPAASVRLNNIVWKLHEQRSRSTELIEMRKRYLEAAYAAQCDSDKKLLMSRIVQLQPGLQRAFLRARLEKLRKKEKTYTEEAAAPAASDV